MAEPLFTVSIKRRNILWLEKNFNKEIFDTVSEKITGLSQQLTQFVRRMHMGGPTSWSSVSRRKGDLYKSTVPIPTHQEGNSVVGGVSIGKGVDYAGIHVGLAGQKTVITAKKKFLAIPLPGAVTQKGTLRAKFKGSLRDVPGLFRPKGKNYLAVKNSSGGITPMFILRQSITVPVRVPLDYIAAGFTTRTNEVVTKAVLEYFERRG